MAKVDPRHCGMFTWSSQVSMKYLSTKCASISEAGEGTFCTLFDNEWL